MYKKIIIKEKKKEKKKNPIKPQFKNKRKKSHQNPKSL